MKLKLSKLIELDACTQQVDLFKEMFGDEVNITQKLCLRVFDKFDFKWAAYKLLNKSALAEYEKVQNQALAEYENVKRSARAEYLMVTDAALAEYDKVTSQALAEYDKVKRSALAEYLKVCAVAFTKCYNNQ